MNANNGYMEKGFYHHTQPAKSLAVKQFILVREKGKRCLLLRFLNETGLTVKGFQFQLVQLDSEGKEIACNKIKLCRLHIPPETTYATAKGIVVKEECADFTVKVLNVLSGSYKYAYRGGKTVALYDVRGYEQEEIFPQSKFGGESRSEKARFAKICRRVAVLALLLVFFTVGTVIYRSQKKFGKFAAQTVQTGLITAPTRAIRR